LEFNVAAETRLLNIFPHKGRQLDKAPLAFPGVHRPKQAFSPTSNNSLKARDFIHLQALTKDLFTKQTLITAFGESLNQTKTYSSKSRLRTQPQTRS